MSVERMRRELGVLKGDLLVCKIHHYLMVAEVAVFSSGAIASVPIILLNLVPTWADIAMSSGGTVLGASAFHETKVTKRQLEQGKEYVAALEKRIEALSQ